MPNQPGPKNIWESERHKYLAKAIKDAEAMFSEATKVMHSCGMLSYEDHARIQGLVEAAWKQSLKAISADFVKTRG